MRRPQLQAAPESMLWIWVLGIELDIFIIGVNPTRDSRKIQGEFLEASTRFRKHRIQCCLLHAWSQAAWPAVVVGWEV
eukprot:COSAG01_NODE_1801_length_9200_cov_13.641358_4_plen_78_part_00